MLPELQAVGVWESIWHWKCTGDSASEKVNDEVPYVAGFEGCVWMVGSGGTFVQVNAVAGT